jgi:hypothetical protein
MASYHSDASSALEDRGAPCRACEARSGSASVTAVVV